MTPTKAEPLAEIEELKEVIRQKDLRLRSQHDELVSLNQVMILINQTMIKALGEPYEPPQLDDTTCNYL
jgi:hypothetical protein